MSSTNLVLLERIQKNIIENIESIKRLVDEAKSLQSTIDTLPPEKKDVIKKHLDSITRIIEQLTKQTIEMLETFKKLVE